MDSLFEFSELGDEDDPASDCINKFIKFDDWWEQFEELKKSLKVHYENINID